MDTTITSAPESAESAVTEAPPVQTGGAGSGTETGTESGSQSEGGTEQSSTEGSQQQLGGRRKWSIQDEVRELRAQRRELREQVSSFDEVRNELAQLREEMMRRNQTGTAKTPANFWQDPEGALDSRLQTLRDELSESITSQFHQTREQEFQAQVLRQEQASATEFIRAQPNYDQQDDEDLIEIIKAIPIRTRETASPQMIAEYAWMKYQSQRGVGDRSIAKQRASSVQGQPPGTGFGRKTWNRAEFDAAVDLVEKNPNDPKNTELFNELMAAHKEGRVKN